ncbi:MAG: hypothetical protein ACREFE_12410, partial [Limisphaerales bacterium]
AWCCIHKHSNLHHGVSFNSMSFTKHQPSFALFQVGEFKNETGKMLGERAHWSSRGSGFFSEKCSIWLKYNN